MSDTSQGPGWWQASDGKWYAPELYPKDWKREDTEADRADSGSTPAVDVTGAMPSIGASADVASHPAPVEAPPVQPSPLPPIGPSSDVGG